MKYSTSRKLLATTFLISLLIPFSHAYQYPHETDSPSQKYLLDNAQTGKAEKFRSHEYFSTETNKMENDWRPIITPTQRTAETHQTKDPVPRATLEYHNRQTSIAPVVFDNKNVKQAAIPPTKIHHHHRAKHPLLNLKKTSPIFTNEKPKSVNEDQIMWMYYGPPHQSEQQEFTHPRRENIAAKSFAQTSQPSSIYDVIDTSKPHYPVYREMSTVNRKSDNVAKFSDNDDSTMIYQPDNETTAAANEGSAIPEFKKIYRSLNDFNENNNARNKIDFESRQQASSSQDQSKSGKFLGKPIVITESSPPNLTAEYYRKLFDSFGNHDSAAARENSNTKKNLQNSFNANYEDILNNSKHSLTFAENDIESNPKSATKIRSAESATISIKDREKKILDTEENEIPRETHHQKSKIKAEKDENKSILKLFAVYMKDVMPKTLKTNIFFAKHLLMDCYTNTDTTNSTNCLQKIISRVLDKAIDSDIIKITDMVSLVKENGTNIAEENR